MRLWHSQSIHTQPLGMTSGRRLFCLPILRCTSRLKPWAVLLPVCALVALGCQSTSKPPQARDTAAFSGAAESHSEANDPDRPAPVLPPIAFFLSDYAS